MGIKVMLTFNKYQALLHKMEVVIHVFPNTRSYIEDIRVPQMLDVEGNKYYLTNTNRYLDNSEDYITVFVNLGSQVIDILTEWLNYHKVSWHIVGEENSYES